MPQPRLQAWFASTLIITSLLTWTTPSYALRQEAGLESSDTAQQLLNALDSTGTLRNLFAPAAPSSTAGLEEDLDDLLAQAAAGPIKSRQAAIRRLGAVFSDTLVEQQQIVAFSGEPVLPDLTPATALGAIAVVKEGVFGAGNKEAIDLASAAHMRPAAERVLRIAQRNWWNRLGEGLRDGVRPEAQISPMTEPVIFNAGWLTVQTGNDPVDGTSRTARGQDGGVSVIVETPGFKRIVPDTLRIENVHYISRHEANFSLKDDSFENIIQAIAHSQGRLFPSNCEVWALDKPYNASIFTAAKSTGARTRGYGDGTMQPSLYMAAFPDRHIVAAGRVGGTEGILIAPPLLNARYPDGRRVWGRLRIVSENYGYQVREAGNINGTVYYEKVLDDQGKPIPANLGGSAKLSRDDILALQAAGYTDHEIEQIATGDLEFGLEDVAYAGDMFMSFIGDPMTDSQGQRLYEWPDVRGVQVDDGRIHVHTLAARAGGIFIVRQQHPDRGLGIIQEQLYDQQRVVERLRQLSALDADAGIRETAREALRAYLPHALNRDLQRKAALGIAGFAGLEEVAAPARPIIGYLPALEDLPAEEREIAEPLQATRILRDAVQGILDGQKPREFDRVFGRLLRVTRGNMQEFAETFVQVMTQFVKQGDTASEQALRSAVMRLAQDPGAPYNEPPVAYYNPARYVYARLKEQTMQGFVTTVLDPVMKAVREQVDQAKTRGRGDLNDVEQQAEVVQILRNQFGDDQITQDGYRFELAYDSLREKDGELYFILQAFLDGGQSFRDKEGVVLELLVTVPTADQQYQHPYYLGSSANLGYGVGLLDPLHYINTRFPEWRSRPQREVYEARLNVIQRALQRVIRADQRISALWKSLRQIIRPSVRQGNNPRFFEAVIRAYIEGNVHLPYHIVHTRSEREYGNQGGVGSIGNLALAIAMRGGLGVTATWYLDDPRTAKSLIGRQLSYSYEMDHHRIDNVKDVKGFAADLKYLLLAYPEALVTGWPSANLQDETKLINDSLRSAWMVVMILAENGIGRLDGRKQRELFNEYAKAIYTSDDEKVRLKAIVGRVAETGELDQAVFDDLLGQAQSVLEPVLGPRDHQVWLQMARRLAQTGELDQNLFQVLDQIYHGTPVTQGLPNALALHWIRNTMLRYYVKTYGEPAGGVPYAKWYIEPDYALDGKPHTVEEIAYLTLMSWISATAHGHELGPMAPSYGNVHGASAGDPNLILAGVLQYAAQASLAYLGYGENEAAFEQKLARVLAIAKKAPHGTLAMLEVIAAQFQDEALRNTVMAQVRQAGERTEAEEAELREFVLKQLQHIPKEMMQALKRAEETRKPLRSRVMWTLNRRISQLPLGFRAAITTHAASGLSAIQLRIARRNGVWVANKSTEFQNIITKMLHIAYLAQYDPEGAQREIARVPEAKAIWEANPLTGQALQDAADLYAAMYDGAAARAKVTPQPNRPFFWTWHEQAGWSATDEHGVEQTDNLWVSGPHGRYILNHVSNGDLPRR